MLGFRGKDYHFSIEEREDFYNDLTKRLPVSYVLLKTCDRVELYYEDKSIKDEGLFNHIKHLFGLASGIESPIIGECHIINQIKNAYLQALSNRTVSKLLNIVFQKALNVGKKVRSETKISEGAPSHSLAAFNLVKSSFKDLKNLRITLIGVNRINEDILKYFNKYGASQVYLGNRTFEKAQALAIKYNANVFRLDKLKDILKKTDVLIVATSAPHCIVKVEDIYEKKDIVIVDLSSPRNVDIMIKNKRNVSYYDIHDVEKIIDVSLQDRLIEKEKAELIVRNEAEKFYLKLLQNFS